VEDLLEECIKHNLKVTFRTRLDSMFLEALYSHWESLEETLIESSPVNQKPLIAKYEELYGKKSTNS
jgi:hypothetical protein